MTFVLAVILGFVLGVLVSRGFSVTTKTKYHDKTTHRR